MRKHIPAVMIGLTIVLVVLLAVAGCQSAPPVPTTTTSVVSTTSTSSTTTSTIVGNDETAYIQNQLDANNSFYVNRTYIVDTTIYPPFGSTITFGPNGKFIRTAEAPVKNGTNPMIVLNTGNVTINNLDIAGPNPCVVTWEHHPPDVYWYAQYDPAKEWHHAIRFSSGSNYVLNNPTITAVWGDAIDIFGPASNPVQNITITNLNASCVGRSIVSNTGSINTKILGGESYGAFWWTFNIEPFGSYYVKDYYIENFQVGWSRYHYLFAGGPNFNCLVENVNLSNITFTSYWQGVSIKACVANEINY